MHPNTRTFHPALSAEPVAGAAAALDESDLLDALPVVRRVDANAVAARVTTSRRVLVVLDDDPTGTQTVADVPVLTAWSVDDMRWALRQDSAAFYVLTNTRSLDTDLAAARNREIVTALIAAARAERRAFALVSRGDSTLRGHYPLETDVVNDTLIAHGEHGADGVLLCPAYVDAGRLTVRDVHWMRTAAGMLPVGASEFALDATFGYRSSNLRDFVEEKSGGRWRAADVLSIGIDDIRNGGVPRVTQLLAGLRNGRPAVVNASCDDDLRVVALAALATEERGRTLLYRTGPSFVRARAGLAAQPPLRAAQLYAGDLCGAAEAARHGLVIVGSHVSQTTRQLDRLRHARGLREFELDVDTLLDPQRSDTYLDTIARAAVRALDDADVVVYTTRRLVAGVDPVASLAVARRISKALVDVVRAVTAARKPRFIVAKGGITSSDVATEGLAIRRAWVRGTMLPGMVSAWAAVDGAAPGVPYVVFAGNVGDDDALTRVVAVLRDGSAGS